MGTVLRINPVKTWYGWLVFYLLPIFRRNDLQNQYKIIIIKIILDHGTNWIRMLGAPKCGWKNIYTEIYQYPSLIIHCIQRPPYSVVNTIATGQGIQIENAYVKFVFYYSGTTHVSHSNPVIILFSTRFWKTPVFFLILTVQTVYSLEHKYLKHLILDVSVLVS